MEVRVTLPVSLTSRQAPLNSKFLSGFRIIVSHSQSSAPSWARSQLVPPTSLKPIWKMKAKALTTSKIKETKRFEAMEKGQRG